MQQKNLAITNFAINNWLGIENTKITFKLNLI